MFPWLLDGCVELGELFACLYSFGKFRQMLWSIAEWVISSCMYTLISRVSELSKLYRFSMFLWPIIWFILWAKLKKIGVCFSPMDLWLTSNSKITLEKLGTVIFWLSKFSPIGWPLSTSHKLMYSFLSISTFKCQDLLAASKAFVTSVTLPSFSLASSLSVLIRTWWLKLAFLSWSSISPFE